VGEDAVLCVGELFRFFRGPQEGKEGGKGGELFAFRGLGKGAVYITRESQRKEEKGHHCRKLAFFLGRWGFDGQEQKTPSLMGFEGIGRRRDANFASRTSERTTLGKKGKT